MQLRRQDVRALLAAAMLLWSVPVFAADEVFSLSASRSAGGIDVSKDWRVQLKGATLAVLRFDDRPARTRHLSAAEIDALRQAIKTPAFATLRQNYGCRICVDAAFCSIEVTTGAGTQHVVRFTYHDAPPAPGSPEGRALAEFHRVWALIKETAGLAGEADHCRAGSPH